jgi:hypothetical protein
VSSTPGLLELLHPDGACGAAAVVGVRCPGWWLPSARCTPGEPVDLVVLGPEAEEQELLEAVGLLMPDGIVCVSAGPGRRRRVLALLRTAGLYVTNSLLRQRPAMGQERLVALERSTLRRATGRWWPPGAARAVRRWHRDVLLIAQRRGARPVAQWVLPGRSAAGERLVSLEVRQRIGRRSIVVQRLDEHGRLMGVAKLSLQDGTGGATIGREAKALEVLGPAVRAAGADLPDSSVVCLPGGCPALLQTPIPGHQVDGLLARRELRFGAFADRLTDWLERWNGATSSGCAIDHGWLDREILSPARAVAAQLVGGGQYLEWLHARCVAVEGKPLPVVAAHCDLTTSNIFLTANGRLGVIDWETSSERGLPLRDLVYCLVDAARVSARRGQRLRAFTDCFDSSGKYRTIAQRSVARLRRVVGLSEEMTTICFHGCWLKHAFDEGQQRGSGEAPSFLPIVERLAQQRLPGAGLE